MLHQYFICPENIPFFIGKGKENLNLPKIKKGAVKNTCLHHTILSPVIFNHSIVFLFHNKIWLLNFFQLPADSDYFKIHARGKPLGFNRRLNYMEPFLGEQEGFARSSRHQTK